MPLTSFYTALTGINNNSLAINVIGDNLANMNTTGFKTGQASFSELLAGMSGTGSTGNPITFGLGSSLSGITHDNSQGTINYTGNSTDAAINGNGFFVVSTEGGLGFTRSGKFQYDDSGNLISSDGYRLMGYMAESGIIDSTGAIVPIQISKGQLIPASPTTSLSIAANLDAAAADGGTFATSVEVYDSLGGKHTLTVNYEKTGTGTWSYDVTIPAEDLGLSGAPQSVLAGDLEFDENGILTAPTGNPSMSISGFANGAADLDIEFGLLDAQGVPTITSAASASAASSSTQNGFAASALKEININSDGVIVGLTENGNSIALAQLALAVFPNIEGLQKYEGSTFSAFTSSGQPSIGIAGTGGRGSVTGSSLEQSNVDMAEEFINLIVAQRAYQANSRIITTSDELYQESINLKR